ncbi:MAG: hypothetical protein ACOYN3_10535 [Acidimicrobiia bacterium]
MSFYSLVLLELVAAVGGALAVGNAIALIRRRRDGTTVRETSVANEADTQLAQAPVLRSAVFLVIGVIACAWSLVTLVAA